MGSLYIYDLIYSYNKTPNNILELASGNCKFGEAFTKYHKNILLSDLSIDMLQYNMNESLRKVVCNMTRLPFNAKYDVVISTFDSINYLLNEDDILLLFKEVKNILTDDGYFLFDVSLENNSINNVKDLNRRGKVKGIKYKQESIYDNIEKIHYNKFNIKLKDGTEIEEEHKQRVYDFFFYFEMAEEAGLFVKDCFECFTFDDAKSRN